MDRRPVREPDELVLPATLYRDNALPLRMAARRRGKLPTLRRMEPLKPRDRASDDALAQPPSGFVNFW